MIELGIIDLSAEGRRHVAALLEKWTWVSPDSRITLPRVSVHLLSPEEIRFHGSLDVVVVGPELIGCDAAFINTLRQQLPGKLILCILDAQSYSFGLVEQLGRLGVDDVLMDTATSDEFFRRLVLLQRRLNTKKKGRLIIVGSARGGVGATFVAASLAEGCVELQKRVCVVDCDVISQDLTRFLQVRPHVSEPLRLLVDQQRVVTHETVSECAQQVWSDEPNLRCVPPAAGGDEALFASPRAARAFVAVLEALQTQHDVVIVDVAALPAITVTALYQVADEAVFVANRDPAGAFAARQALTLISGYIRPDARITTVLNDNSLVTASLSLMRDEALAVPGRDVNEIVIPRTAKAARWPCSGYTPYQFLKRQIDSLLRDLDAGGEESSVKSLSWWRVWCNAGTSWCRGVVARWRLGRRGGADVDRAPEPPAAPIRYREIAYGTQALGEGELVSRPVLLS